MFGGDIVRCPHCAGRFLCFLGFHTPSDYSQNRGDSFTFVWFAIFAGMLSCVGIATWTLYKFHRWPF